MSYETYDLLKLLYDKTIDINISNQSNLIIYSSSRRVGKCDYIRKRVKLYHLMRLFNPFIYTALPPNGLNFYLVSEWSYNTF